MSETFSNDLIEAMWCKGVVAHWYCKPKQKSVVDFLRVTEDPFFEGARRFGKTTSVLAYVTEESIKNPIITRWCEPWKNQCREIVMPEMDQIQKNIPARYRFEWKQTDSYYECRWTGSQIKLRGVNEDRGESARGPKAHIIVCDELGSWRYPTYVIGEVLSPQLITTKGKLIFMGTPPKNGAHVYYVMKDQSKAKKAFIQREVHDQEIVEWKEIEKAVARAGGWESAAVQREYLCKKVADPNFQLVPEWDDKYAQDIAPDEYYRFYHKYEGLDIGVRHQSVNLLGYYDFKRAAVVITDEIVKQGKEMTTAAMAHDTRVVEILRYGVRWEEVLPDTVNPTKRWKMTPPNKDFKLRRISDIDLLFINDMTQTEGMYFEATDKGHLDEMTNQLRIWTKAGRVLVNPRCATLIDCLRYGIWDEERKEWESTETLGHFDALAALMYLVRNIDAKTNPIPPEYGLPKEDYFFKEEPGTAREDKLKKIFNVYQPQDRLKPY